VTVEADRHRIAEVANAQLDSAWLPQHARRLVWSFASPDGEPAASFRDQALAAGTVLVGAGR
jgi:hypothetical protein